MRTDRPIMQEKDPSVLWQPDTQRIANSHLMHFIKEIDSRYGTEIENYPHLHQWSVDNPEKFWLELWRYYGPIVHEDFTQVLEEGSELTDSSWFSGCRLNLAQNILEARPSEPAIIFINENGRKSYLTQQQLLTRVAECAQRLLDLGVDTGDTVMGILPNIPEAIIGMLATQCIGAVWCCVPPEYRYESLVERVETVEPKVIIASDGYTYNGQTKDLMASLQALQEHCQFLAATYIVPYNTEKPDINHLWNTQLLEPAQSSFGEKVHYEPLDFEHPSLIVFSSGTTEKPRAIAHNTGGVLLQLVKEHCLQADVGASDRLLFDARPGEASWYWHVGSLLMGATLIQYDGSFYYPDYMPPLELVNNYDVTVFGVRPTYLTYIEKMLFAPNDFYRFEHLRSVLVTDEPILSRHIDYVYENMTDDVRVSSLLVSADILGCFGMDHPLSSVSRGEFLAMPLGMDMTAFKNNGKQAELHDKGELVCLSPVPSMPLYLLDDVDNKRFDNNYRKYQGLWGQGDYIELTEDATFIYHGRTQTIIHRPEVDIGVNELYRHSQKLDEVLENAAVSIKYGNEEKLMLFVRLMPRFEMNEEISARINGFIRISASEELVPWLIVAVDELPKTLDGKISEVAIKRALLHQPAVNAQALQNPDLLADYERFSKGQN